MKKISDLIAHFNNYEHFKDCHKSFLKQTFQDFEVVIAGHCSTGDSFEKISKLTESDTRFRLFRNEKDSGVGFSKRKWIHKDVPGNSIIMNKQEQKVINL